MRAARRGGGCANPRPGPLGREAQAARPCSPAFISTHLPLGSPRPHLLGTSIAPRHRLPTFISPHSGYCLRDFTEMLIPGPRKRPGGPGGRPRAPRGEGGRRAGALGAAVPVATLLPRRSQLLSPVPSRPPGPGRPRTRREGPGQDTAGVLWLLKQEAAKGRGSAARPPSSQLPALGGDPVTGESRPRVSDGSLLGLPGPPNPRPQLSPLHARTPCRVLSFKVEEVYLEFIHLTLWEPHWKQPGSVWLNGHHIRGTAGTSISTEME